MIFGTTLVTFPKIGRREEGRGVATTLHQSSIYIEKTRTESTLCFF